MKSISKLWFFAGAAALAALLAVGGSVNAQTIYFWSGDYRVGLHLGADHSLQAFNVKAPMGFTVENVTPALAQPKFGIYYGMEKDLSGYFAFGFEASADLHMLSSLAMVKNTAGTSFDYSFSTTGFSIYEGVYLAYFLTDEFELTGGVGIDEGAWFNGKSKVDPAAGAPGVQFGDGMMMGINIGVGANVGVTYYLSESFYVKGNLHFASAPLYGSSTISSMMGDDWSDVWSDGSSLIVNPDGSIRLGLMATIGLKW